MTFDEILKGQMIDRASSGYAYSVEPEPGKTEFFRILEERHGERAMLLVWQADLLAAERKARSLEAQFGAVTVVGMTIDVAMETVKADPDQYQGLMVCDGSQVLFVATPRRSEGAVG